jgi:16S rRNA (cytosine967-C5)-methyltransferase
VPEQSARRLAQVALQKWRAGPELADTILARLLAIGNLSALNRAFALELFYGVLRNLTLLDFWIKCLRQRPVNVDLTDILRLGLYQVFLTRVREHAAVYESVALAPKRHRALVNGILRTAVRQRRNLTLRAEAQPLSIRMSHPDFLIDRWQANWGRENAEALCTWNNAAPTLYARINRLRISPEQFAQAHPDARPVQTAPGFVELRTFPSEALVRGECYIQDPSTRLACEALEVRSGEKVLDACAAPGGKTCYLAELMNNRGVIVACDRQSNRLEVLRENTGRLGASMVRLVRHDWLKNNFPDDITSAAPFDRVLIDVPCSNTGVMRRRVDLRWRLRPGEFKRMHDEQVAIARAVVPLLKLGGTLVYSTCSLEPEENRLVLERIQEQMSILRLEQQVECLPFRERFDGAFAARLVRVA